MKHDALQVSRRGILVGGAASAALTAAPAITAQSAPSVPAPATMPVRFTVNGKRRDLEVDTRTTLLDALREHLHLTGTKKGCDHGQCGACTVIVEGQRINSCLSLAVQHRATRSPPSRGWARPRNCIRCRRRSSP